MSRVILLPVSAARPAPRSSLQPARTWPRRAALPSAVVVAVCTLVAGLTYAARPQQSAASHAVAALPPGLMQMHAPRWITDLATLDAGVQAQISQDRRDGFSGGSVAEFGDGPRHMRLVARVYRSETGAGRAYARAAGFLHRVLPDPVLRTRIVEPGGLGRAAILATYASAFGRHRYTATALIALGSTRVCEAEAFPQGMSDGRPSRDLRDLQALVGQCLSSRPSGE